MTDIDYQTDEDHLDSDERAAVASCASQLSSGLRLIVKRDEEGELVIEVGKLQKAKTQPQNRVK